MGQRTQGSPVKNKITKIDFSSFFCTKFHQRINGNQKDSLFFVGILDEALDRFGIVCVPEQQKNASEINRIDRGATLEQVT